MLQELKFSYRTPETFDIVSETINVETRKNLAQVSRMLTQITSGREFGDENPCYVPVNDYIRKAVQQMTSWLFEGRLASVNFHSVC